MINKVSRNKYLGITINHELSWNEHIHKIVNKAVQINAFLYWN